MGIKPVKKRPFLLLEILVALFLSSMLLLICMKALTSTFFCKNKVEKAQQKVRSRQSMYKSLLTIFKKADVKTLRLGKEKRSISFNFENIMDTDLFFAGQVLAKIYIDANKGLLLSISKPKSKKNRIIHLDSSAKKLQTRIEMNNILTLQVYDQEQKYNEFVFFIDNRDKIHA